MVAFSDALNKIDGKLPWKDVVFYLAKFCQLVVEFWRIRSLIASTARGVRRVNDKAAQMSESQLAGM